MFWGLLRKIFFLLDPEIAHDLSSFFLRLRSCFVGKKVFSLQRKTKFHLAGIPLDSPLGLAAGFDKDGKMIPALRALGFGFIEIGSVTPEPQSGNPAPRLFRLPHSQALINRMGFNSEGAVAVARRLTKLRANRSCAFPIGINLGKNRETPLERAADDYVKALRILYNVADYLVVNLSSPNTPHLTELQEEAYLKPLLEQVRVARDMEAKKQGGRLRPLLLKISPDLRADAMKKAAEIAIDSGFTGIIASNTSRRREFPGIDPQDRAVLTQEGGLSGAPLGEEARNTVYFLRKTLGPKPLLISAGGIMSMKDGQERLEAGADLLQAYTGFIYGGPCFPRAFQAIDVEKSEF